MRSSNIDRRGWLRRVMVPHLRCGLLIMAACLAAPCMAGDIYIQAEFKADRADPDKRTFTNTTPWSGVCNGVHLPGCIANNWWSIDTGIRGTKQGDVTSRHGPGSFFVGMPPPRQVSVISADGRDTHLLEFIILGTALRLIDADRDGLGSPASTGPARNCQIGLTNGSANNYSVMRMFIRNDGGAGSQQCTLDWLYTNNYDIAEFDLTYALVTPDPLDMRAGTYTGRITYTVGGTGSGADFDLGNDVVLNDSTITVNFSLFVHHDFQLTVPPESNRAVLAPEQGWERWRNEGVAPRRLQQTLPFQLSSSSRFSVSLQCQHTAPDGRCALSNTTTAAADVPLDIALTVPGAHDSVSGRAAVDFPLTSTMTPPLFAPDGYLMNRPSRLHFSVTGAPVADMLRYPGSRYAGDVTVVFDADP